MTCAWLNNHNEYKYMHAKRYRFVLTSKIATLSRERTLELGKNLEGTPGKILAHWPQQKPQHSSNDIHVVTSFRFISIWVSIKRNGILKISFLCCSSWLKKATNIKFSQRPPTSDLGAVQKPRHVLYAPTVSVRHPQAILDLLGYFNLLHHIPWLPWPIANRVIVISFNWEFYLTQTCRQVSMKFRDSHIVYRH